MLVLILSCVSVMNRMKLSTLSPLAMISLTLNALLALAELL